MSRGIRSSSFHECTNTIENQRRIYRVNSYIRRAKNNIIVNKSGIARTRVSGAALRFVCVYVRRLESKSRKRRMKRWKGEGGKKEREEKDETRDKRGGKKKEKGGGERVRLITI